MLILSVTCRAADVARERVAKVVNEMGLASAKVCIYIV